MQDRMRFIITGVVALCAVALTVGGSGLSLLADHDDRGARAPSRQALAALKDFDGVNLQGPDSVVVTRGAAFAVQTDGDPKALERLNIYVSDHMLNITRRKSRNWFTMATGNATVHVTLPALERLAVKGSGDMTVDKLSGARVDAMVAGSGDLTVNQIDAEAAVLTLSGSGNLKASGLTGALTVNATGSGDLDAKGLDARTASVRLVGSGDVEAHARESAKLTLIGSGDAHIAGTNACQISKMGSGEASCTS